MPFFLFSFSFSLIVSDSAILLVLYCIAQEWACDRAHGKGTKTFAGGDQHVGGYNNDRRHGYGVYTWANGDRFEGCWVNGEQKGKGTYYYRKGNIFQGHWLNGKKHGRGTFTANNISLSEMWEHGVRTSRYELAFCLHMCVCLFALGYVSMVLLLLLLLVF